MLNIQYLRELCEKATKGPWELVFGHNTSVAYGLHGADGKPVIVFRGIGTPKSGRGQNNIRLIAATREALPELLDRVEALEKALEESERALDAILSFEEDNLLVVNWHLNGDTEPLNNFFYENGLMEALEMVRAALKPAGGES